MRLVFVLLALPCLSCTDRPTREQQVIVSELESIVSLPKGGGDLECYERHYALLQGNEIEEYFGLPFAALDDRKILVGHYRLGGMTGVHWAETFKDLPAAIMDGGCSDLRVFHVVGDPDTSVTAECSFDLAGDLPEEVDPPVTC